MTKKLYFKIKSQKKPDIVSIFSDRIILCRLVFLPRIRGKFLFLLCQGSNIDTHENPMIILNKIKILQIYISEKL